MKKLIKIGPFGGMDNVGTVDGVNFQRVTDQNQPRQKMAAARNIDFDDDGWFASRKPVRELEALDGGLGGWAVEGRVFYQDGSVLYEKADVTSVILTGLANRVSMCMHWGTIYVTDGVGFWALVGQTVQNWGLPIPELTLAPAGGTLGSGQYLVQCAFVDAQGNEGGTSDVSVATLSSATGISIAVAGQSKTCSSVNVYVSKRDQKQTSYLATIQLGSFPYTIQSTSSTTADPPKTLQMTGPITGAAGVFSFRAFLLMWRDGAVFRSESAEPGLFHGENFFQFGSTVRACEGVAGGMWIGTASGLWWVQGEDPSTWVPVQKTYDAVAKGSLKLHGWKIRGLNTKDLIALFVTSSGLVAGMSDGSVVHLTDGIYKFDAATRASFAYAERNNLRQIFINLVDNNGGI